MSETYTATAKTAPEHSSMPVLYLRADGTEFLLHEDARRHFKDNFKPELGFNMAGYIRIVIAQYGVQEVRKILDRHYQCVPWKGHVAVLGPKLNGHMASLRKNKTLRDIVANDSDGLHTIQRGSGREIDGEDREMLASNTYEAPSLGPSQETQLE